MIKNLNTDEIMGIIIDSRMRKIEKDYLSNFGELIEISPQNCTYNEISAHPDIFFCKISGCIFKAPNLNIDIGIPGNDIVNYKYPNDVKYNVCQIGENVVHNFEFTDKKVLDFINSHKLKKIQVKQGYSNCSISVISDNACITSDTGIYRALKSEKIDCLLLKENNIKLLNKDGIETKMKGFIGGASCVINNEFILFGDSNYLKNKDELINFLNKYSLKLTDFKGLNIYDYGGVIILT